MTSPVDRLLFVDDTKRPKQIDRERERERRESRYSLFKGERRKWKRKKENTTTTIIIIIINHTESIKTSVTEEKKRKKSKTKMRRECKKQNKKSEHPNRPDTHKKGEGTKQERKRDRETLTEVSR